MTTTEQTTRARIECATIRAEIERLQHDLTVLRRRLAWAQQDLHEPAVGGPRDVWPLLV